MYRSDTCTVWTDLYVQLKTVLKYIVMFKLVQMIKNFLSETDFLFDTVLFTVPTILFSYYSYYSIQSILQILQILDQNSILEN